MQQLFTSLVCGAECDLKPVDDFAGIRVLRGWIVGPDMWRPFLSTPWVAPDVYGLVPVYYSLDIVRAYLQVDATEVYYEVEFLDQAGKWTKNRWSRDLRVTNAGGLDRENCRLTGYLWIS